MPQRLALITASVMAVIVLTVGLVAAGFVPAPRPDQAVEAASNVSADTTGDALQPPVEPKVVYIKPAPKPKTVVVDQPVTTRSSTPRTTSSAPRKTVVRSRNGGDDESERSEGGREREREHERDDD